MKHPDTNAQKPRRTYAVWLTAGILAILLIGCAVTAGTQQEAEVPADDVVFEEPPTPEQAMVTPDPAQFTPEPSLDPTPTPSPTPTPPPRRRRRVTR